MQLEELYAAYFDPSCRDLPYQSDREYLTDLLAYLDMILNMIKSISVCKIPRLDELSVLG